MEVVMGAAVFGKKLERLRTSALASSSHSLTVCTASNTTPKEEAAEARGNRSLQGFQAAKDLALPSPPALTLPH